MFRSDFLRCPNDGSAIELVDRDPLLGHTVGSYVVDAFIGDGAVGRVYRVHHERLQHRHLALKVMIGDFASSVAMRLRFAQEAAAASKLEHANVVPVVDFGKSDTGLLYLAMELVDGVALSNLIGDRPMQTRRVLALARQMCLGLQHAHDNGIIHRDFKPDNVLVVAGPNGEVPRIADFGLAISADPKAADVRLTGAGMSVGTPAYAAPEQIYGNTTDHRADLFALGVTMYEMLAGAVPFDGTPIEVMHLNATASPPPIKELAPSTNVPPRLEHLVRRMMSPNPAMRPSSAAAVLVEIDRIRAELKAASRSAPGEVAHGSQPPAAVEASAAKRTPVPSRVTPQPTQPAFAPERMTPRPARISTAIGPIIHTPYPLTAAAGAREIVDPRAATIEAPTIQVDDSEPKTTHFSRVSSTSMDDLLAAHRPRRAVVALGALTAIAVAAAVGLAFQRADTAPGLTITPIADAAAATTSPKDEAAARPAVLDGAEPALIERDGKRKRRAKHLSSATTTETDTEALVDPVTDVVDLTPRTGTEADSAAEPAAESETATATATATATETETETSTKTATKKAPKTGTFVDSLLPKN